MRPPSADADCSASCNAHASFTATCTPAVVNVQDITAALRQAGLASVEQKVANRAEAVARVAYKTNEVIAIYPITPASDILHELSKHKNFGVRTFQAEDEIAAAASALGAAFGALLYELFGEADGFAASLAEDDAVAGAHVLSEVEVLDGFDSHRHASGEASTAWARLSSGPSIMRPSKSMVPIPRAVAASYAATSRAA